MVYRGSFIDMLEALFGPFYGLDIPSFYGAYHPIIDFFLYAAVLVSVARLTLDKAFPGKPGKALAVAIGLMMAVALSIAERTLGFSIKSFGPIAAGIIVALVGLVIYHLCRKIGAGTPMAASLALIIVYFSVRSVVPNLFEWMQHNKWAAFLHALLVLAILMALWRVLAAMFRSPAEQMESLARKLEGRPASEPAAEEMKLDRKEIGILKHRLSKFVRGGARDSERIVRELQDIIELIRRYGSSRQGLQMIAEKLRQIQPAQHRLLKEVARIRDVDIRLRRFDMSQLRELQAEYQKLSPEQKRLCMRRFEEGRAKLDIEKQIAELASGTQEYQKEFRCSLEMAVKNLSAGHTDEAIAWLEKAIEQEQRSEELLKKILDIEKRLITLVRRQLRQAGTAQ